MSVWPKFVFGLKVLWYSRDTVPEETLTQVSLFSYYSVMHLMTTKFAKEPLKNNYVFFKTSRQTLTVVI